MTHMSELGAAPPTARAVGWEGFVNARDLGGLPTRDGGQTRFGAFVRSAAPRFVTAAGWQAAYDAGLRTIIDLRNPDEIHPDLPRPSPAGSNSRLLDGAPPPPPGIGRVEVAIDDADDVALWRWIKDQGINGTPLYYRPFLDAKAERCAAALRVLAATGPGTVLFHCAVGRDRTGLVTLLLLSLAGVEPDAIADDYAASATALAPVYSLLGLSDQNAYVTALLTRHGTTTRQAILDLLDGFDAETYLRAAGVPPTELAALRGRLTAPKTSGNPVEPPLQSRP